MVCVSVLFAIKLEVVQPRGLLCLLGRHQLFVHVGMLAFQYVTYSCLRNQVMLSSHSLQLEVGSHIVFRSFFSPDVMSQPSTTRSQLSCPTLKYPITHSFLRKNLTPMGSSLSVTMHHENSPKLSITSDLTRCGPVIFKPNGLYWCMAMKPYKMRGPQHGFRYEKQK